MSEQGAAVPAATFSVAHNPDPESKLPYLIQLPLQAGALVLKAAEPWPRTAKVYCHRAEGWPERPDMIEEVPVRACVRRGQAVDLVLDRARETRSQIVFTTVKGREAIFWQSPKTTRRSRPAVRVPARRASGARDLAIAVDTRERYPFRFSHQQASTYRKALPAGDYGVEHDGELVAVVERKAFSDLAATLVDGSLTYALAELATVDRAALVVEDRYGAVFKAPFVAPGFLADLLGALQVRYPQVPIVFCDTRPLAEEWTFRFLGAALARARQADDAIGD
ncbi:MAG: ERCC4 domain-containing protein [Acidimicrobiales bacterium]